jgi:hypothetical protein
MGDSREVLAAYFAQSRARQHELRQTKATDSGARVALKHLVPVRYRGTGRMILTDLVEGANGARPACSRASLACAGTSGAAGKARTAGSISIC